MVSILLLLFFLVCVLLPVRKLQAIVREHHARWPLVVVREEQEVATVGAAYREGRVTQVLERVFSPGIPLRFQLSSFAAFSYAMWTALILFGAVLGRLLLWNTVPLSFASFSRFLFTVWCFWRGRMLVKEAEQLLAREEASTGGGARRRVADLLGICLLGHSLTEGFLGTEFLAVVFPVVLSLVLQRFLRTDRAWKTQHIVRVARETTPVTAPLAVSHVREEPQEAVTHRPVEGAESL